MNPVERKAHFARVAQYPCWVSGHYPVTIAHCHGGSVLEAGFKRGMAKKPSDWLVLPIAFEYHLGRNGMDVIGIKEWEAHFGRQVDMLEEFGRRLKLDLFALARADLEADRERRIYRRSAKILPHRGSL